MSTVERFFHVAFPLPLPKPRMSEPKDQSAPTPHFSLPNELIAKITNDLVEEENDGHLAKGTKLALIRCALVNKAFCHYCQEQLFSRLDFSSQNIKQIPPITAVLERSPHIRKMVKSVVLSCFASGTIQLLLLSLHVTYATILRVRETCGPLLLCRNIEQIQMNEYHHQPTISPLDEPFYTELLSLPKIKTVVVESALYFPIFLLQACFTMQLLSLQYSHTCFMAENPSPTIPNQVRPAQESMAVGTKILLRKLKLVEVDEGNSIPFFTWLTSPASFFDLSRLESLELAISAMGRRRSHTLAAIQALVDGLPNSIRSLTVTNRARRLKAFRLRTAYRDADSVFFSILLAEPPATHPFTTS